MYLSARILSTEAIPSGKEAMEFVLNPSEGSAASPFNSKWKEAPVRTSPSQPGGTSPSQPGGIGDTTGLRIKDIS